MPPWAAHWTKLSKVKREALVEQGEHTLAFWGWFRDGWTYSNLSPVTRPEQSDAIAVARALNEQAYDGKPIVVADLKLIIDWVENSNERTYFVPAQRRPQSLFRPINIEHNLPLSRAWRDRNGTSTGMGTADGGFDFMAALAEVAEEGRAEVVDAIP